MNVVWFAEIKWAYLRTRKQQLVLRRPPGVEVVFFEPYVRGRENRYDLRSVDGIHVATIPFVKSIPGRGALRTLVDQAPVRSTIDAVAKRRVRGSLAALGIDPAESVFVISNIYALHVAQSFSPARLVYDCNDAHSDFPGAPSWARAYRDESFRAAHAVVVSAERLRDDAVNARGSSSNVHVVGNGVDFSAFRRVVAEGAQARTSAAKDATVRIGYLGAIAPWLDFELIAAAARARPRWSFDLVGPVLGGVEMDLAQLLTLGNVRHRPAVSHDSVPGVLLDFTVGMIPFRRTSLTAAVNPNKLYEYLAVGLPTVTTPFSPESQHYAGPLHEAETVVAVANDANELVKACEALAEARRDASIDTRKRARATAIASAHDWRTIAAQFWRVVGSA